MTQNDRGRPIKKRKFYIYNENYKFVQFLNVGPESCVTVTQPSKRFQGILYSLPRTKVSCLLVQSGVSILTLHVCSLSRTYTQQCTFERQCTTKALMANTQLLYLNCFRLETHNLHHIDITH